MKREVGTTIWDEIAEVELAYGGLPDRVLDVAVRGARYLEPLPDGDWPKPAGLSEIKARLAAYVEARFEYDEREYSGDFGPAALDAMWERVLDARSALLDLLRYGVAA